MRGVRLIEFLRGINPQYILNITKINVQNLAQYYNSKAYYLFYHYVIKAKNDTSPHPLPSSSFSIYTFLFPFLSFSIQSFFFLFFFFTNLPTLPHPRFIPRFTIALLAPTLNQSTVIRDSEMVISVNNLGIAPRQFVPRGAIQWMWK